MNENNFLAWSTITETIRQIEQTSHNSQECWDIALKGVDLLYSYQETWGRNPIDELISILADDDRKTRVLAMLYLGMLHDMGLNATDAIEPIRQAATRQQSHIITLTMGIVLAMLGHPDYVQAMVNFMKENNIPNVREFNRGGIATVLRYIRTGEERG